MKKIIIINIFVFLSISLFSQVNSSDTLKNFIKKNNVILEKQNQVEAIWDNGIPILPDDEDITNLVYQLNEEAIIDVNKLTKEQVKIYRELGVEFYNRGMYQEADFYLSKIKNYTESKHILLKEIFKEDNSKIKKEVKEELEQKYKLEIEKIKEENKSTLTETEKQSVEKDKLFSKSLPTKFDDLTKEDLEKLSEKIESQIKKLTKERDDLVKNKGSQELIDSKNNNIKSLKKDKEVIDLSINNDELKEDKIVIERWLWGAVISIIILVLSVVALLQRKTIKVQDIEIISQLKDINKKNTYLEYAARIIRHDMHSGINTYIPRGISSLERRISEDEAKNLKIDSSIKMIKEGLNHTQKVYKSVYEFTNLVKQNVVLEKKQLNLKTILENYLYSTSYKNQVIIDDLIDVNVNEILFCNAIDNLIRNGLKYNNSDTKVVKIFMEGDELIIQDNGTGLDTEKFKNICLNNNNKETESGLGINISLAILTEHKFDLSCEKLDVGTKMKIKIK